MNEADVKFIQEMIVHHRAAIKMAKSYLEKTSPNTRQARVADWARQIAKGQADEIEKVSGWLRSSGKSVSKSSGMNM